MLYIDDRQEKIKPTEEFINKIKFTIDFALREEGVKIPYQISLLFVDNEEIRTINKENRNIDRETDVLSFPMFEKEEINNMIENGNKIEDTLGDVMISIPRVSEQAIEYGHSFERELSYMLIHGFYHLMGYDHMEEEEKKVMREKEEVVLNSLNITR